MKIILVGNGRSLFNRNLGPLIDSHDVIVRFNFYRIGGYEADVGTRTTHWAIGICKAWEKLFGELGLPPGAEKAIVWPWPGGKPAQGRSDWEGIRIDAQLQTVEYWDWQALGNPQSLLVAAGAEGPTWWATTGLAAILICRHKWQGEPIAIAGFGGGGHYASDGLEVVSRPREHRLDAEDRLLERWREEGWLKICDLARDGLSEGWRARNADQDESAEELY